MTQPTAYPLAWPPGWPRTPPTGRQRWSGQGTLSAALGDLHDQLRLMGASPTYVLSSNYTLGVDHPADPGVVVYFAYQGDQLAMPCDRWATIAGNVRAIARTIEALRGLERWGAKHMIKAMFQGFRALPSPGARHWQQVLGLPRGVHTAHDVEVMYRRLAEQRHPDKGGSHEAMAELNQARDVALKEIGG